MLSASIVLGVGTLTVTLAGIDTLVAHTNAYFAGLQKTIGQSAGSSKVSALTSSITDQFFVGVLKEYGAVNALLRTNSKGLVLSEVVRGRSPRPVRRSEVTRLWCASVMQTRTWYRGSDTTEDPAHPVLLWSEPIVKSGRLVGVLCAKVDMAAGIGEALAGEAEPFVVMRNGRPLYTNLWKDTAHFVERSLALPGDSTLVIRCAAAPPPPPVDSAAMRATQDSLVRSAQVAYEKTSVKETASPKPASFGVLSDRRALAVLGVVLAVALGLLYVVVYRRETRVLRATDDSNQL
jgi:hypothetical protein